MDNYGFTHYYGRHKGDVVRSSVVQSEKKQFRIGGELLKKFNEHKPEENESEFIRELIKEALERREELAWQEEVANW